LSRRASRGSAVVGHPHPRHRWKIPLLSAGGEKSPSALPEGVQRRGQVAGKDWVVRWPAGAATIGQAAAIFPLLVETLDAFIDHV